MASVTDVAGDRLDGTADPASDVDVAGGGRDVAGDITGHLDVARHSADGVSTTLHADFGAGSALQVLDVAVHLDGDLLGVRSDVLAVDVHLAVLDDDRGGIIGDDDVAVNARGTGLSQRR